VANLAGNDMEDSFWPQLWLFQTCRFNSDDDPAPGLHDDWLTQDEQLNHQRENINNFIRRSGCSPGKPENQVIRAMENFNSGLPRYLDLLGTRNTEEIGETHAPAQEYTQDIE